MSDDENTPPTSGIGRKRQHRALQSAPRKRPCVSDPYVHYGRHFGRTVHALLTVNALVNNGLLWMGEHSNESDDSFSSEERREHQVFCQLLQLIPGLEDRLMEESTEGVRHICDLIQKGANGARADDTKSLKSAIIDWITPKGGHLNPPLARNMKSDRGFNHEQTGALLCPTGMDWNDEETKEQLRSGEVHASGDKWPTFIYDNGQFDPEDPWNGAFRSALLVTAYKHIFTSPSSVDKEPKATRSGNAQIHGMKQVTKASIAYVTTQVRFALCSSSIFSQSDYITDSQYFYDTILDLFEHPRELKDVNELLTWWNRKIFPAASSAKKPAPTSGALGAFHKRRLRLEALASRTNSPAPASNSQ